MALELWHLNEGKKATINDEKNAEDELLTIAADIMHGEFIPHIGTVCNNCLHNSVVLRGFQYLICSIYLCIL